MIENGSSPNSSSGVVETGLRAEREERRRRVGRSGPIQVLLEVEEGLVGAAAVDGSCCILESSEPAGNERTVREGAGVGGAVGGEGAAGRASEDVPDMLGALPPRGRCDWFDVRLTRPSEKSEREEGGKER